MDHKNDDLLKEDVYTPFESEDSCDKEEKNQVNFNNYPEYFPLGIDTDELVSKIKDLSSQEKEITQFNESAMMNLHQLFRLREAIDKRIEKSFTEYKRYDDVGIWIIKDAYDKAMIEDNMLIVFTEEVLAMVYECIHYNKSIAEDIEMKALDAFYENKSIFVDGELVQGNEEYDFIPSTISRAEITWKELIQLAEELHSDNLIVGICFDKLDSETAPNQPEYQNSFNQTKFLDSEGITIPADYFSHKAYDPSPYHLCDYEEINHPSLLKAIKDLESDYNTSAAIIEFIEHFCSAQFIIPYVSYYNSLISPKTVYHKRRYKMPILKSGNDSYIPLFTDRAAMEQVFPNDEYKDVFGSVVRSENLKETFKELRSYNFVLNPGTLDYKITKDDLDMIFAKKLLLPKIQEAICQMLLC